MAARAAAATAAVAAASALGAREPSSMQPVQQNFGAALPGFIFNPRIETATTLKSAVRSAEKGAPLHPVQPNLLHRSKQAEPLITPPIPISPATTNNKCEPPANAPRGPAAWRDAQITENRLIQQRAKVTFPTPLDVISVPTPSIDKAWTLSVSFRPPSAWSQSKAWVSEKSRQQAAFKRMKANAARINAGNSPSLPQTLAEFLELKKWKAERDQKTLQRKISLLETQQKLETTASAAPSMQEPGHNDEKVEENKAVLDAMPNGLTKGYTTTAAGESEWETEDEEAGGHVRKAKTAISGPASKATVLQKAHPNPVADTLAPKLLGGKSFGDNLSPVFASDSCWNDWYTDGSRMPADMRVDWPSKMDLQEYGESRSQMGMRRSLPPPRENRLTSRLEGVVYNKKSSLHGHLKNIRLDRLSLVPCDNAQEALYSKVSRVQQLGTVAEEEETTQLLELPDWLQATVEKARNFTTHG